MSEFLASFRFHFDFATYFRMLRLAWEEDNLAGRRRLFFLLLAVVPTLAGLNAVCFFLDGILFPGLHRVRVRTPVFNVGHARSGTTLMHRIMSQDERFSCFLMWELYFPSILQKKLVRGLGRLDRRLLGGRIDARIRAWEKRKFAATEEMHETSLIAPEEDDSVLLLSCASGFWIVFLPYMGKLDFYHVDRWPERRRRRLLRFYAECVRRQLYLNGPQKIHLSKNPTFAGRVEALLETFPDARIVVPLRNPFETIPSLLKLMQTSWTERDWDEAEMNRALRVLAEQSIHTYRYPLEVLARHPETRRAIVDYRELVAEPRRTIERVYAELGFPVSRELARVLGEEQRRARAHASSNRYSLEEFGLEPGEIRAALADFFARYRWDEEPARAAAGPGRA
jgi:hypothetical protein